MEELSISKHPHRVLGIEAFAKQADKEMMNAVGRFRGLVPSPALAKLLELYGLQFPHLLASAAGSFSLLLADREDVTMSQIRDCKLVAWMKYNPWRHKGE